MYEGELKDSALKEKPVIYYWDERDGAEAQGWWIGVGVGGALTTHTIRRSPASPLAATA